MLLWCLPYTLPAQTTITEEFDGPTQQWTVTDNGSLSRSFKNGTMVIDAYQQGYMNVSAIDQRIDLAADFTLETKLKFILGVRKSGFGLTWGYRTWNNYNVFYITSEGYAGIFTMNHGQSATIMDWKEMKKKTLHQGTEYNVLKIEKKGTDIFFYINNEQIYQTTANRFSGCGTWQGYLFQNNMKILVDHLTITAAENKMNLVDHPINGFKLENLGEQINVSESDRSPLIAPDGQTLYYVSDRTNNALGNTDIWISTLENGQWSKAINPGAPLNNSGHNFVVSVTPDGNTLLVGNTYNEDGSAKGAGVSISVKRNGQWSIPVEQRIEGYVNHNEYSNFLLTPDGTKLMMCIENDESIGEKDFFISFLNQDNTWSKPRHMGNTINSFGGDYSPFLAADGKTLFFASDGRAGYGSSDVYMTRRLDDTWLNWSEPKNLGPEINTAGWEAYYCIPAKGNYAYMVATNAPNGFGSDDIYRIKVAEDIMPDPVVMVKGRVYNKKTNELIEADIRYESLENTANGGKAYSTLKDGFALALPKGSWYGFQASAPGFIPVSENIDLKNLSTYDEKQVNLYLVPIEKGQVVRLNNIFFDFGKASLRQESNNELDRLLNILNENTDMKIEIGGHTDDKGSDEFNRQLSNDRARAVADYLLARNVGKHRITYKGYGETKPLASNTTEEGAQMNRRVEFTIK